MSGARKASDNVIRMDRSVLPSREAIASTVFIGIGEQMIVGEPGIGKSRLVEEFHARLGATPHTWADFSSSQLLQNTPLHPIAEWGRLRFGDADGQSSYRLCNPHRSKKAASRRP